MREGEKRGREGGTEVGWRKAREELNKIKF